jgi:hypothetical protein
VAQEEIQETTQYFLQSHRLVVVVVVDKAELTQVYLVVPVEVEHIKVVLEDPEHQVKGLLAVLVAQVLVALAGVAEQLPQVLVVMLGVWVVLVQLLQLAVHQYHMQVAVAADKTLIQLKLLAVLVAAVQVVLLDLLEQTEQQTGVAVVVVGETDLFQQAGLADLVL